MNKNLLSILILAFFSGSLFSQNNRYLSYIFPSDSLKGFDEISANQDALQRGFFGKEYKVFMYRAKRNFINDKFGYSRPELMSVYKTGTPKTLVAPCINEDFEASTSTTSTSSAGSVGSSLSGWTISTGSNSNSCAMAGCCSSSGSTMAWVRATPYSTLGPLYLIPNSPLGGTKVLQLNDSVPGTNVIRIEQTFSVTLSNNLFEYAYMAALNGVGHACCDKPYMNIQLFDCSLNNIACATNSIVVPGSGCSLSTVSSSWVINTSGVTYTSSWEVHSIDLTPYIGSCVTIQVTVSDCDGGAHQGWAFFDARCGSSSIMVNNIPATTFTSCASTATLTAPTSGPYLWNGPAGSGITNYTTSSITTTASGTYTLSVPSGSCSSSQTLALIVSPGNVSIGASALTICQGASVNLTANGTGMTSYTWNTGATTPTIAATPSISTTYSVAGTNTAGCVYSANQIINVSLCTGIEQNSLDNAGISIFPNPNSGTFNIQSKKEEIVTITNELGQLIQTINLNTQNKFKYTVTNLSSGIYFIGTDRTKQKIVVQR